MTTLSSHATSGIASFSVGARVSGNLDGRSVPAGMPPAIPASQLYFWSRKWQAQELEADQARRAGDVETFRSADDLLRWLLTPDG